MSIELAALSSTPAETAAPEAERIRRAQKGDASAFEQLYRAHVDHVVRLARWLLHDERVEDEVQEIFFRAWCKLGGFAERAQFRTWLHRLAVNYLLRQRETRARSQGDRPLEEWEGATVSEPGATLDLDNAIAALPVGCRAVFVLYDVEGYSHEEIANLLGISAHTSRSQLHRARMLLRNSLR